jgi:hypothetical protein
VMCFGRHQHYQEFFIASNPIFASKQECCPFVQKQLFTRSVYLCRMSTE